MQVLMGECVVASECRGVVVVVDGMAILGAAVVGSEGK